MGIIFTKYETSTDVIFDSSKFDSRYDDDDFPRVVESDVQEILLESGEIYNLTRQTNTEDSMGNVIDVVNTNYRIFGMFQDITIKDRKIHSMGLAVSGNRKFYMMPEYSITSAGITITYEVKEGDIITDSRLYTGKGSTGQFRVIKILRELRLPNNTAYKIAIVRSINLDGTA